MLSDKEFAIIQDLCNILEPLKELTEFLSASHYATMSIVFPALHCYANKFLPAQKTSSSEINILKNELANIIKRRFIHVRS